MIPGVSRSAASIVGGIFAGLDRKSAVEFSFLLAVPTMTAATGLDLLKSGVSFSGHEWLLLTVGFVGAYLSALITVKLFIRFVQKNSFIPFAIYRIIIAIVLWQIL
jgi:undecaprenyl-diphosphatase